MPTRSHQFINSDNLIDEIIEFENGLFEAANNPDRMFNVERFGTDGQYHTLKINLLHGGRVIATATISKTSVDGEVLVDLNGTLGCIERYNIEVDGSRLNFQVYREIPDICYKLLTT